MFLKGQALVQGPVPSETREEDLGAHTWWGEPVTTSWTRSPHHSQGLGENAQKGLGIVFQLSASQ